jgi:hypothetical protein
MNSIKVKTGTYGEGSDIRLEKSAHCGTSCFILLTKYYLGDQIK